MRKKKKKKKKGELSYTNKIKQLVVTCTHRKQSFFSYLLSPRSLIACFFFHPLIIAQQLVTIAHRLLFLSPAHHRSAAGDDRSSPNLLTPAHHRSATIDDRSSPAFSFTRSSSLSSW
jgi:hypothetical protein